MSRNVFCQFCRRGFPVETPAPFLCPNCKQDATPEPADGWEEDGTNWEVRYPLATGLTYVEVFPSRGAATASMNSRLANRACRAELEPGKWPTVSKAGEPSIITFPSPPALYTREELEAAVLKEREECRLACQTTAKNIGEKYPSALYSYHLNVFEDAIKARSERPLSELVPHKDGDGGDGR